MYRSRCQRNTNISRHMPTCCADGRMVSSARYYIVLCRSRCHQNTNISRHMPTCCADGRMVTPARYYIVVEIGVRRQPKVERDKKKCSSRYSTARSSYRITDLPNRSFVAQSLSRYIYAYTGKASTWQSNHRTNGDKSQ